MQMRKKKLRFGEKNLNEHFQSKYSTKNNIIMQIKWPSLEMSAAV